jgi:hypothetical protein
MPILLGLLSGLMHLARSDGLLWLAVSFVAVCGLRQATGDQGPETGSRWSARCTQRVGDQLQKIASRFTHYALRFTLLLAGYLLIMAPWFLRNLEIFGALLAPGGSRALWLTRYDELYAYPASFLTPAYWWASGFGAILEARMWALGQNLVRAFAVQGNIFLTPLILLGAWRLRRHPAVRLGGLAWLLTLLAMTAAFPFQGARGGFFHSGAALQLLFLALAPAGLGAFVDWGARVRGWQAGQARAVFGAGLVGLAVMLAALVFYGRVIGKDPANPSWAQSEAVYVQVERAVQEIGATPGEPVAVNNPPGYFAAAGRPAIAIPNGDVQTLVDASRRYGARLVILEYNHPQGLDDLYANPCDRPDLVYLHTLEGTHIFEVVGIP